MSASVSGQWRGIKAFPFDASKCANCGAPCERVELVNPPKEGMWVQRYKVPSQSAAAAMARRLIANAALVTGIPPTGMGEPAPCEPSEEAIEAARAVSGHTTKRGMADRLVPRRATIQMLRAAYAIDGVRSKYEPTVEAR